MNQETRRRLLRLARTAIQAELFGAARQGAEEPWPPLERQGVFVTLRTAGRLRGCIGTFVPEADLPQTVRSMAANAAKDPRFTGMPLSASDMKDLRIEISILSPLTPIADPLSLEPGRHGVYIRQGSRSGCFLPSVAADQGWDAHTFLTQCCSQKAGLAPLAWQDCRSEVFVFTVEKFSDDETAGPAGI